ncbi:MAG TPA: replicative DNA helicase [Rickettsiales bacterium]|nr:replicative DNA helicase [Rickettsiales bacterium]
MQEEKLERPNLFNIEAEQAVLGTIILNNEYLGKVNDILKSEDFYESAHQKIYEYIIHTTLKSNIVADSITLKTFFENDEDIKNIGGSNYLSILLNAGTGIIDVADYASVIKDLALKRHLVLIGEEIVNNSYKKSSNVKAQTLIEEAEGELFNLSYSGENNKSFVGIVNPLAETVNKARLAIERGGAVSGIPTDYLDVDRLLGGFQNGDLVIIACRPSMGKTALALNFAYNAVKFFDTEYKEGKSKEKKSVGFFSLEMPADQLASRILSRATGINASNFRTGDIEKEDFDKIVKKADEISKLPFFIDDTPALTIAAIKTRIRRMVRQKNLGIVFVDYLQLAQGTKAQSRENRVLEIGEITMGLKAIAKEFSIPVIALSQLSRLVEQREDKRPQLSDLRESGTIEQDADIVMFLHREEYYEERKKPIDGDPKMDAWIAKMDKLRNKAEVIVAKHRNGPIGTITLRFISALSKFEDYAGQYDKTDN